MLKESNPTGAAAFLTGAKVINRMDSIPAVASVPVRRVNPREFDPYLVYLNSPSNPSLQLLKLSTGFSFTKRLDRELSREFPRFPRERATMMRISRRFIDLFP